MAHQAYAGADGNDMVVVRRVLWAIVAVSALAGVVAAIDSSDVGASSTAEPGSDGSELFVTPTGYAQDARTVATLPLWEPELRRVHDLPVETFDERIVDVSLVALPIGSARESLFGGQHEPSARRDLGLLMFIAFRDRVVLRFSPDGGLTWGRVSPGTADDPVFELADGPIELPSPVEGVLQLGTDDSAVALQHVSAAVDATAEQWWLFFSARGSGRRVLRDSGTGDPGTTTWVAVSDSPLDFVAPGIEGEPSEGSIVAQVVGPRRLEPFVIGENSYGLSSGGVVSHGAWLPSDPPTTEPSVAAWMSTASERNTDLDDAIDEAVTGPIPEPDPERTGVLAAIDDVAIPATGAPNPSMLFAVDSAVAPVPTDLRGISTARLDTSDDRWWRWRFVTDGRQVAHRPVLLPGPAWEGDSLHNPAVAVVGDRAVVAYLSQDRRSVGVAVGSAP